MAQYKIIENRQIASDVYWMSLEGACPVLPAGTFVEIQVPDCYLRRPFSVAASDEGRFAVIYKVVGKGTDLMSRFPVGQQVEVLVNLGNGFDLNCLPKRALLAGGGLGVAPLYQLARVLKNSGVPMILAAGFNTGEDVFLQDEFATLCDEVHYATMDGSLGHQGFVTELFSSMDFDYYYACGPLPMLKAVHGSIVANGQLSLEARMGCGFGICMGCTIETVAGPKRVCKEGPVFRKEELPW